MRITDARDGVDRIGVESANVDYVVTDDHGARDFMGYDSRVRLAVTSGTRYESLSSNLGRGTQARQSDQTAQTYKSTGRAAT